MVLDHTTYRRGSGHWFCSGHIAYACEKIKHIERTAWVIALLFGYFTGQTYGGNQPTMQYKLAGRQMPMMEIATLLEANTEPGSLIGLRAEATSATSFKTAPSSTWMG
ncbi:MAG: hypothetical protein U0V48_19115 [Anaerolineales bacterium]